MQPHFLSLLSNLFCRFTLTSAPCLQTQKSRMIHIPLMAWKDGGDSACSNQVVECTMISNVVYLIIGVISLMPGHTEQSQVRSGCTLSSSFFLQTLLLIWPFPDMSSSLLPAIAFTLDMYRRTGEFYGINESLFASALAAMVFSILGAQPITIVGITGLIALFNFTTYDIIKIYDVSLYPRFMCWTGIWAAIFHWLVSVWNFCDYMRYVTDFSSESFGMYVGIIYISKHFHACIPSVCLAAYC